MINLDHYFQNNNAIDPPVGSYRTNAMPLVNVGDSMKIEWFQFIRKRDGGLRGITPAISAQVLANFHVGLSATFLNGWSDDEEHRLERGLLTMFYNTYRLDSVYRSSVATGSSRYTAVLPTIGLLYEQEYYTAGVTLRFPASITREWTRKVETVNTAGTTIAHSGGSDKLALPFTYALGIALHPAEDVDVSVDYDVRSFADAEYTPSGGSTTSPWLTGSTLRAGIEYRMLGWLSLRAGTRGETQVFARAGDGLLSEPVTGTTYTGGLGFTSGHFAVDVAYEYTTISYEDMYQSNINFNRTRIHTGILEIGYIY
jgi:opacity protein-like surface antigen